jgi:benzylsuccinate CoA-transferase BbsF subunit
VNPNIILLSSNGFGQSGPWTNYKSYGPITEAIDGLMELTGYPDGPPQRSGGGGLGVTFPDIAGAYFGTFAMLAALERRQRTGHGEWLDLSHMEAGVATIPEAIVDYTMNGRVRGRIANRDPGRAPQGVYPCEGSDRWIAISVASDEQFKSLVDMLSLRSLATDERFGTSVARHSNHDELDELIIEATRTRCAEDLERELQAAGVEAAVVANARDVWLDPQLRHRSFFEMVPAPGATPEIEPRPFARQGWKMSGADPYTRRQAPNFGEHTREVLQEYLSLDDGEVEHLLADLTAEGVIADRPRAGIFGREPRDPAQMLNDGLLQEIDEDFQARLRSHLQGGGATPGSATDLGAD